MLLFISFIAWLNALGTAVLFFVPIITAGKLGVQGKPLILGLLALFLLAFLNTVFIFCIRNLIKRNIHQDDKIKRTIVAILKSSPEVEEKSTVPWICGKCGHKNDAGSSSCEKCGDLFYSINTEEDANGNAVTKR